MICLQKVFYGYLGAFLGGEQMFSRLYFALNDVKKRGLCAFMFGIFRIFSSKKELL